jgi:uncharacterized Zn finger protein
LIFRCEACGHTIHSDLNAGNNIKEKTIVMRHDLIVMGRLSTVPEVSSDDRCETAGVTMQAPDSLDQG